MTTFTVLILKILFYLKAPVKLRNIYVHEPKFWNYICICGIGVIINQFMLHYLVKIMYLWIANFISIAIAFMWNYINALGYFSKYWGMND